MPEQSLTAAKKFLDKKRIRYKEVDGVLMATGNIHITQKDINPSWVGRLTGKEAGGLLPDLSHVHLKGNFDCSNLGLVSLLGAPRVVEGNMDCSGNRLANLMFAPAKVGGNFDCSRCSLTQLKWAPSEVGGSFICSHNSITSLDDAPQTIGRDMICANNHLSSLEPLLHRSIGGKVNAICNDALGRLSQAYNNSEELRATLEAAATQTGPLISEVQIKAMQKCFQNGLELKTGHTH